MQISHCVGPEVFLYVDHMRYCRMFCIACVMQGNIHLSTRVSNKEPYAVSLTTRSPNNNVCTVAKKPATIAELPDTDTSNCQGTLGKSLQEWTLRTYDTDKTENISIDEFKDTVHALGKFCSPFGPLKLLSPVLELPYDCDDLVQKVFPSVTEVSSYRRCAHLQFMPCHTLSAAVATRTCILWRRSTWAVAQYTTLCNNGDSVAMHTHTCGALVYGCAYIIVVSAAE